jgi:hypothetical protein
MEQQNSNTEVLGAINGLRQDMSGLLEKFAVLNERISAIQKQQEGVATHADRLKAIETRMEIAEKQGNVNRWLIAVLTGVIATLLTVAASHLTWH